MRIKVNISLLIALFIILNIIIFGGIFFLLRLSSGTQIFGINISPKAPSVSFLDKDIENLRVNSRAFIIYDTSSRTVIEGKNENLRFSPASSAKIMTATIALEEYPLDKIIAANGVSYILGSSMNLAEGELITVNDLLYGLMLPSGNDAAYALSKDYIGGSEEFINRMNEKAKELNLANTYFADASGLKNDNYSTAFDLARLATYAMQNEKFREIVKTRSITVTDLSGNIVHDLKNLNELLILPEVIGVKTGFTDEAGGVLVTAVDKDDRLYIIVVLNSLDRFFDTKEILTNIIQNIKVEDY